MGSTDGTSTAMERIAVALERIADKLTGTPVSDTQAETDDPKQSRRSMAMAMFAEGKTVEEIASYLGVARSTVYRWQNMRKAMGLDDYRDRSIDHDGQFFDGEHDLE